MAENIHYFKERIEQSGVIDPSGIHHEFASGMHGCKVDFDLIGDKTGLYDEWVRHTADYLKMAYKSLPEFVVGVANGTNRLALDVARRLDGEVIGVTSRKDSENTRKLFLSDRARDFIDRMLPNLVVVVEDVGTTGSNSVQVAEQCLQAGARSVEVLVTWQRRDALERLEEKGIAYHSLINQPLQTFSPEQCQQEGYCAQGWRLISRNGQIPSTDN